MNRKKMELEIKNRFSYDKVFLFMNSGIGRLFIRDFDIIDYIKILEYIDENIEIFKYSLEMENNFELFFLYEGFYDGEE
jgi:hypothetical protein